MSDSDSSTEADPQAVGLAHAQAVQIAVAQQRVAQLGNQLDANGRLPIRPPLILDAADDEEEGANTKRDYMMEFIIKFRADAKRATMAQSRAKTGDTMDLEAPSQVEEEEAVLSPEEIYKAGRWLQDAGFDPDDINKACFVFHDGDYFTGVTPLIFFAREGNLTMCRYLAARGADCRKVTAGNRSMQALGPVSPMLAAASHGKIDVCDWLYRQDGGAKNDLRRTPNNPGAASPVYAVLDYEWISEEDRFAILPWMIRHGAFARADGSGGVDDATMRDDLYPNRRCWMFDKRLNILVWARMFVAAHDTFRLFLKGTILSSSSIRRRHPSNDYGTRSKCVKVSPSPVALLKGTSGILEMIAAYVGTPKANDVRTVRQLIDLLSTFIDDTPFDKAEEEEEEDEDEFDHHNY